MAKIIYTPIGKPSKKTSRGLKRATAHFYVGSAKVPGNHVVKYVSLALNGLGIFGMALYWYLHKG